MSAMLNHVHYKFMLISKTGDSKIKGTGNRNFTNKNIKQKTKI